MKPARRRQRYLYVFECLISAATYPTALGGPIITGLALAMGLGVGQIGAVAGLIAFMPAAVNLLVAGRIEEQRLSRQSVALGYAARSALPVVFLLLVPVKDPFLKVLLFGVNSVAIAVCYTIANTQLDAVVRLITLPRDIGRMVGSLGLVGWTTAIPALWVSSRVIDRAVGFEGYWRVLGVAALAGIAGSLFMLKVRERVDARTISEDGNRVPARLSLAPLRDSIYRKYTAAVFGLSFGIGLVAPFYNVYLIQGLQLRYETISFMTLTSMLGQILFVRTWNRGLSSKGPWQALFYGTLGLALGQLLLVSNHVAAAWLFVLGFGVSGNMGAFGIGIQLSDRVIRLGSVRSGHASSYFAISSLLGGLSGMFGSAAGGKALQVLVEALGGSQILAFRIYIPVTTVILLAVAALVKRLGRTVREDFVTGVTTGSNHSFLSQ